MEIEKDDLLGEGLDIKKVTVKEITAFCEKEGLSAKWKPGMSKAKFLNAVIDELEPSTNTAPHEEGRYGLGIRPNGEHICPTPNGSPDKGSNYQNRHRGY